MFAANNSVRLIETWPVIGSDMPAHQSFSTVIHASRTSTGNSCELFKLPSSTGNRCEPFRLTSSEKLSFTSPLHSRFSRSSINKTSVDWDRLFCFPPIFVNSTHPSTSSEPDSLIWPSGLFEKFKYETARTWSNLLSLKSSSKKTWSSPLPDSSSTKLRFSLPLPSDLLSIWQFDVPTPFTTFPRTSSQPPSPCSMLSQQYAELSKSTMLLNDRDRMSLSCATKLPWLKLTSSWSSQFILRPQVSCLRWDDQSPGTDCKDFRDGWFLSERTESKDERQYGVEWLRLAEGRTCPRVDETATIAWWEVGFEPECNTLAQAWLSSNR